MKQACVIIITVAFQLTAHQLMPSCQLVEPHPIQVCSVIVSNGRIFDFSHAVPSGSGVVRLWRFGSTSLLYSSGRVQIYYNSQWGNICDDSQLGLTEAHVICHQLGYTGASSQSRQSSDRYEMNFELLIIIEPLRSKVNCFAKL